jgi:hypothetical protein
MSEYALFLTKSTPYVLGFIACCGLFVAALHCIDIILNEVWQSKLLAVLFLLFFVWLFLYLLVCMGWL